MGAMNASGNQQDLLALKMFEQLQKYVGERVICHVIIRGKLQREVGVLKKVTPFDSICLTYCNRRLPFIDKNCVIYCIYNEFDNEFKALLYENPNALDCTCLTDEKVESARRQMFGDTIVDSQIEKKIKQEIIERNTQKCAELKYNSQCYQLMKEGLSLIKSELIEEWLAYVNVNALVGKHLNIVSACVACLKALDLNSTYEQVEQICVKLGFKGEIVEAILTMAVYFSYNGEKYQQYWGMPWAISQEQDVQDNNCLAKVIIRKSHKQVPNNHYHI